MKNLFQKPLISKLTIAWALFLITSAFYMRQVLNFLRSSIGNYGIGILLLILFAVSGFYIINRIYRAKLKLYRIVIILIVLGIGYLYAYNIEILEEKVHIIKYGLLGWLALNDYIKSKYKLGYSIMYSLGFCLLVVSIDEGIQWFLPWRVGDMRDVGFAFIGGTWGAGLYLSIFSKNKTF